MIEIFGFIQLDDYNGIARCGDTDNSWKWYLFTFTDAINNHSVELSHSSHFMISEINPKDFVWRGVRISLEVCEPANGLKLESLTSPKSYK